MKYHVNPETGNPGICKAKHQCKFGDIESDHYESKEEAREAYEKKQEGVSKNEGEKETKLSNLKIKNADLTKQSLNLKRHIDNLEEAISISTSTGDAQDFEEDYKVLQAVEKNRAQIIENLKEVQKEIQQIETELKTKTKKATVSQLRNAREEVLLAKAASSKIKNKLKNAEESLRAGIASRAPIAEIKPLFNEVVTLKEAADAVNNRSKSAMSELKRLEELEPKRKPNKPDTTDYTSINSSSYGCGGGSRC